MNGEYFCVLCRYGSELQRKILRYSDKGAAKLLFRFMLEVQTKIRESFNNWRASILVKL